MKRIALAFVLVFSIAFTQGCAYLNHQGEELAECIDIGFTFSSEPHFAAFVIFPPVLALFPIGYGEVDGHFVGIGGGAPRFWSPYYEQSFGVELYGQETVSFDKNKAQLEGLSEDQLRREATFYRSGIGGWAQGPDVTEDYAFSCPHYIHLGFFGIVGSPRYSEAIDFLTGWFGIDLMDLIWGTADEEAALAASEKPAAAPQNPPAKTN